MNFPLRATGLAATRAPVARSIARTEPCAPLRTGAPREPANVPLAGAATAAPGRTRAPDTQARVSRGGRRMGTNPIRHVRRRTRGAHAVSPGRLGPPPTHVEGRLNHLG